MSDEILTPDKYGHHAGAGGRMTEQDIELIARRVADLIRPEEPWLDKAGIADHLKVSTRTVELEMRDNGMPYVTMFGRSKFKASEVERWLVDSGRRRVRHSPDQSGPAALKTPRART